MVGLWAQRSGAEGGRGLHEFRLPLPAPGLVPSNFSS